MKFVLLWNIHFNKRTLMLWKSNEDSDLLIVLPSSKRLLLKSAASL